MVVGGEGRSESERKASLFVSSGALFWHQNVPSPDNQP